MASAWRDPLLLHPRVAGRRLHGAALLAVGASSFVFSVFCAMRAATASAGASVGLWTLFVGALVAGVLAFAIGWDEVRRPVHVDLAGRPHDAAIQAAALRWHPKLADVVDEFRRTTRLYTAGGATIGGAVREEFAGAVRARLVFEGAPFRVGAAARMKFDATPTRGEIRACRPTFHLRCLRETPEHMSALLSKIECLARLIPSRTTRAIGHGTVVSEIEFDVPAGAPGADLLARRPVYWELTVEIAGLRAPYLERFFVPVSA